MPASCPGRARLALTCTAGPCKQRVSARWLPWLAALPSTLAAEQPALLMDVAAAAPAPAWSQRQRRLPRRCCVPGSAAAQAPLRAVVVKWSTPGCCGCMHLQRVTVQAFGCTAASTSCLVTPGSRWHQKCRQCWCMAAHVHGVSLALACSCSQPGAIRQLHRGLIASQVAPRIPGQLPRHWPQAGWQTLQARVRLSQCRCGCKRT